MFKPEIMEIPDEWDYDTEVSGALTLVVPETSIKHMRCQTPEAASCKEEKPGAILSNDRRKLPGGRIEEPVPRVFGLRGRSCSPRPEDTNPFRKPFAVTEEQRSKSIPCVPCSEGPVGVGSKGGERK